MFGNQFLADFSDLKYEDIKIEMKSIFESFSIERYLQSFSNTLIFLGQIYYFSKNTAAEDLESKLYIYAISLSTLRLLYSGMNYFQLLVSQEINQLFLYKKYYEIGDLFKRAILVAECFNIIFYFPFKYLFQSLLTVFIFERATIVPLLTIPLKECQGIIGKYLYLNFYSLLMRSICYILGDIMLTFHMNSFINLNSIMRVVINITFCKYFCKKYNETYFMTGIAYANIITEIFSFIFLLLVQHIKNPYPQAWVQFNLQFLNFNTFTSLSNTFELSSFFSFELFHYWDDFFLLIFSCIIIGRDSIHYCTFLFALMIFKTLLFHIKRKDKEEVIAFYHKMQSDQSSSTFNKLSYEYDSPNQSTKGNYQWMMFIKTKMVGTIVINLCIGIIYVLFYFIGGFQFILKQSIEGWWYIVPLFSFNALIEQCTYQAKGIREYILKKDSLKIVTMAFTMSLICFTIVDIFLGKYFALLIIGMYCGYYFLLYKFIPEIKNVDMRIVNLELLIYSNIDQDNNYADLMH